MRTFTVFALVAAFALALVHAAPAEEKGYLGIMLKKSDNGIEINGVVGDSPAEKAGIKEGDVIKKLNGDDVAELSLEDFVKKIQGGKPGDEIKLTVLREGKEKEIKVKLGKAGD